MATANHALDNWDINAYSHVSRCLTRLARSLLPTQRRVTAYIAPRAHRRAPEFDASAIPLHHSPNPPVRGQSVVML